eukprot:Plantae.Rhodophyta-Hildenbrandia_rubra.ctg3045.p1 GENE.Plantae.Rhodophyta-Hildenbrandia_rubra.ctg3045~~Plantae.Rhodophyta-Hildenbrandia_rubra.ctg3045.p1  ORF type:complete len:732 (-),score=140.97 Plantae.Rhodophyta-Hildenbrandia_rubra.ctg3045:2629-4824(-)
MTLGSKEDGFESTEESIRLTSAEGGSITSSSFTSSTRYASRSGSAPLAGLASELRKVWTALPAWWNGEREADDSMKNFCQLVSFVLLAFFIFWLPVALKMISPEAPQIPGVAPDLVDGAKLVTGENGVVAADNGECSKLGVKILSDGGNAVDAMVGVVLCQGVLAPFASGLGGGAFILIHTMGKEPEFYDARETAPGGASENMFKNRPNATLTGGLSVGVPGELKGIYEAHKSYGRVEWKKLLIPVVELANDGPVSAYFAEQLVKHNSTIMKSPSLRATYTKKAGAGAEKAAEVAENAAASDSLPTRRDIERDVSIESDGEKGSNSTEEKSHRILLVEGDRLKQPRLAHTLAMIADRGASAFYDELASNISSDVQAAGGIMTAEDILNYNVVKRTPLVTNYHGLRVVGAPPPSSGGACIAMGLNILQGMRLRSSGRNAQSLHLLAETFKFIFGHRPGLADPDHEPSVKNIVKSMLSQREAWKVRRKIHSTKTYRPSYYAKDLLYIPEDDGTSHISILDANGTAVALTTTINGAFGSKVLSESTGILLNNEMDDFSTSQDTPNQFGLYPSRVNRIKPLKRPLSSMSPTIVLRGDTPFMVVGGSGGPRIITSTFQTLINVLDFGDDIATAVSAPRLHHQLIPNVLSMESINSSSCEMHHAFKNSNGGVPWKYWTSTCKFFRDVVKHHVSGPALDGCVQGIVVPQTLNRSSDDNAPKKMFAASDPRKIGLSAAY